MEEPDVRFSSDINDNADRKKAFGKAMVYLHAGHNRPTLKLGVDFAGSYGSA
jgi:hypothetical protein